MCRSVRHNALELGERPVKCDRQKLASVLKSELTFLESGGYRYEPASRWRATLIFEDSPICLNYHLSSDRRPCDECVLMQFVPGEYRLKKVPCRYVPLNSQGETLDSLYRSGTQEEVETAVTAWLKGMIRDLESAGDRSPARKFCAAAETFDASKKLAAANLRGGQG